MTARHRVSKMLLRHGRVILSSRPGRSLTGAGLAVQQFDETAGEFVFADLIASVDRLSSRKAAIAERLSRLA